MSIDFSRDEKSKNQFYSWCRFHTRIDFQSSLHNFHPVEIGKPKIDSTFDPDTAVYYADWTNDLQGADAKLCRLFTKFSKLWLKRRNGALTT